MSYKLYTGNDGKRHWIFDVDTRKFKELEDADVDDIQNREDLYPLNSKKSLIYFNKIWGIYLFMKCDKIISVPSDWLESFKEAEITNASIIKTKNGGYTMRNRIAYNTQDLSDDIESEFLREIFIGFMESMRWLRQAGITPCKSHIDNFEASLDIAHVFYNLLGINKDWQISIISNLKDACNRSAYAFDKLLECRDTFFNFINVCGFDKLFPWSLTADLCYMNCNVINYRANRVCLSMTYRVQNEFNVGRTGVETTSVEVHSDGPDVYIEVPVRLCENSCVKARIYITGLHSKVKIFACSDIDACPNVHADFITMLYLLCDEGAEKSLLEPYILSNVTREDRLRYFDSQSMAILEHSSELYGIVHNKVEIFTEAHNMTLKEFMDAFAQCIDFKINNTDINKLLKYIEFKDGDFAKVETGDGAEIRISYYRQGEFIGSKLYNFTNYRRYFNCGISQKEREISIKEFNSYFKQEWIDLDDYSYSPYSVLLPQVVERHQNDLNYFITCINRLTGAIYVCVVLTGGMGNRHGCNCLGSEAACISNAVWLRKFLLCDSMEKAVWLTYILNKKKESRLKKSIAQELDDLISRGACGFPDKQYVKDKWGIIGSLDSNSFARFRDGRYIE